VREKKREREREVRERDIKLILPSLPFSFGLCLLRSPNALPEIIIIIKISILN
jgi:hypothetical protein